MSTELTTILEFLDFAPLAPPCSLLLTGAGELAHEPKPGPLTRPVGVGLSQRLGPLRVNPMSALPVEP